MGGLDPPLDDEFHCCHHTRGREDVGRDLVLFLLPFQNELPGQGVWFAIPRLQAVGEGKIKMLKEEGPAGLPGVQSLGGADILKAFVVRPHQEGVLGPLDPVPLFLQGHLHRQELPVALVIVGFCWLQPPGEKGAGVELLVPQAF